MCALATISEFHMWPYLRDAERPFLVDDVADHFGVDLTLLRKYSP